jgi:hypothetical protein
MALQHVKLADIQQLPSSVGSLYANPASTKTYIRGLVLFNDNNAAELVKLHNVPDSAGSLGSAGVSNKFLEVALAAKETLLIDLPYPIVLTDQNDSLQGVSTTAAMVTIQILGDKE